MPGIGCFKQKGDYQFIPLLSCCILSYSDAKIIIIILILSAPTHSLLTSHFSLLTSHFSLLTSHFSLLTSHFSLLTSHFPLLTSHFSLLTSHFKPFTSTSPKDILHNPIFLKAWLMQQVLHLK